jgi:hypothetical protein
MHRDVGAPLEERFFDLFHEEPLASDLGQWAVLDLVPRRDDLLLDKLEVRMSRLQARDESAALSEREGGAAGGVDEARHIAGHHSAGAGERVLERASATARE